MKLTRYDFAYYQLNVTALKRKTTCRQVVMDRVVLHLSARLEGLQADTFELSQQYQETAKEKEKLLMDIEAVQTFLEHLIQHWRVNEIPFRPSELSADLNSTGSGIHVRGNGKKRPEIIDEIQSAVARIRDVNNQIDTERRLVKKANIRLNAEKLLRIRELVSKCTQRQVQMENQAMQKQIQNGKFDHLDIQNLYNDIEKTQTELNNFEYKEFKRVSELQRRRKRNVQKMIIELNRVKLHTI